MSGQGTTVNPYRYTGQQLDSLTGLYDLRARYYDPASGRFTSRDTAGVDFRNPVDLNRYVYTHADPLNFSDPSGHQATAEYVETHQIARPWEKPWEPVIIGAAALLLLLLLLLALPGLRINVEGLVQSLTRTPSQNQRASARVQLQEQVGPGSTVHHNSIPLVGSNPDGSGVTTAQTVAALVVLRNDPVIPKREQANAGNALASAVAWVLARPPAGVFGQLSQSFYFRPQTRSYSWRLDYENLFGKNLTI